MRDGTQARRRNLRFPGNGVFVIGSITGLMTAEKFPVRSAVVGRNCFVTTALLRIVVPLRRKEKEQLVFDDWAAECTAELIALQ